MEDLKNCLVYNNDPGYPYVITSTEDVKVAAAIAAENEGSLGDTLIFHTAAIIPIMIERITQSITAFENVRRTGEQVGSLMLVTIVESYLETN